MSDAPELKPCPFCGGQADIWKASVDLGLPAWIACTHCKEGVFCTKEHSTTEAAIAAWNRRAPDPRVAALVDAAKDALCVLEDADCYGSQVVTDLVAALAAFKGGADA